jgi:ATP-dependent DNA helicase RecQ
MANNLPINNEEFLEISGVGQMKLEKYGDDFMELCLNIKENLLQNNF